MEPPLNPSADIPLQGEGTDELDRNDSEPDDDLGWRGQRTWEPAVVAHASSVTSLAVSPDSQWVASGSRDAIIILWETESRSVVRKWKSHDNTVWHLAFSPDSLRLASSGEDGRIMVWDVDTGELLAKMEVEGHTPRAVPMVIWSPDGTKLASSSNDETVRIWDAQTYTLLKAFKHPGSHNASVIFSHSGRYLASGSAGYNCRVWNVDTSVLHKELSGRHRDGRSGILPAMNPKVDCITTAAFDPQDHRIAAASMDGRVWIWDVNTDEELVRLHEHSGPVWAISFSPGDGKHILSGSSDWTLKICDSFTGERVMALDGHEAMIQSATFSPDGQFVVSASLDNTVRLWRRRDGTHSKTFDEHDRKVTHALFSPDGERCPLDRTMALSASVCSRTSSSSSLTNPFQQC